MITSAWLTAVYMKSLNFNKKAYLIGRKAIADELNEVGIECFGFGVSEAIVKIFLYILAYSIEYCSFFYIA